MISSITDDIQAVSADWVAEMRAITHLLMCIRYETVANEAGVNVIQVVH